MNILNLTQHTATQDQAQAGVFEPTDKKQVQELLTFNEMPTFKDMLERARTLAQIAKDHGATHAMIGGAGFFIPHLEHWLLWNGITPVHAFSVRESIEVHNADGTVSKQNVFKHIGFYEVSDALYEM